MREIEDANVLHKSDNDYNKDVVKMIKAARRAKNPRDYIDYLGGVKGWEEIERGRTEWEMAGTSNQKAWGNNPKEWGNANNTQNIQKMQRGNELIENVKNIDLVVEEVIGEDER